MFYLFIHSFIVYLCFYLFLCLINEYVTIYGVLTTCYDHLFPRDRGSRSVHAGLRLAVRRYAAPRRGGAVDPGWDGNELQRVWCQP